MLTALTMEIFGLSLAVNISLNKTVSAENGMLTFLFGRYYSVFYYNGGTMVVKPFPSSTTPIRSTQYNIRWVMTASFK